jgi:hypothetical protein
MSSPDGRSAHAGFCLTIPIANRALITDIQILHAHKSGEEVFPYPGIKRALWDTGATSSTISGTLASQLCLPVTGEREMRGAGGRYRAKEYLSGLLLPNHIVIPSMSLYEFAGSDHFDMLIGMDIISLGDFLVSKHNDNLLFSFHYPSMNGISLDKIQSAMNADGKMITKDPTIIRRGQKIGRNEPCPCNSGRKYKNCCGK